MNVCHSIIMKSLEILLYFVNDYYTDFYQNLSIGYERWLKSLNITNFDDLREIILLENI